LKNIVNIDTFFSSGAKDEKPKSSKKSSKAQIKKKDVQSQAQVKSKTEN
jgi:hypothetical protein